MGVPHPKGSFCAPTEVATGATISNLDHLGFDLRRSLPSGRLLEV
jgi:hypothetical protein